MVKGFREFTAAASTLILLSGAAPALAGQATKTGETQEPTCQIRQNFNDAVKDKVFDARIFVGFLNYGEDLENEREMAILREQLIANGFSPVAKLPTDLSQLGLPSGYRPTLPGQVAQFQKTVNDVTFRVSVFSVGFASKVKAQTGNKTEMDKTLDAARVFVSNGLSDGDWMGFEMHSRHGYGGNDGGPPPNLLQILTKKTGATQLKKALAQRTAEKGAKFVDFASCESDKYFNQLIQDSTAKTNAPLTALLCSREVYIGHARKHIQISTLTAGLMKWVSEGAKRTTLDQYLGPNPDPDALGTTTLNAYQFHGTGTPPTRLNSKRAPATAESRAP